MLKFEKILNCTATKMLHCRTFTRIKLCAQVNMIKKSCCKNTCSKHFCQSYLVKIVTHFYLANNVRQRVSLPQFLWQKHCSCERNSSSNIIIIRGAFNRVEKKNMLNLPYSSKLLRLFSYKLKWNGDTAKIEFWGKRHGNWLLFPFPFKVRDCTETFLIRKYSSII